MADPKQPTPDSSDSRSEALNSTPDLKPGNPPTSLVIREVTRTGRSVTILGVRMPAKNSPQLAPFAASRETEMAEVLPFSPATPQLPIAVLRRVIGNRGQGRRSDEAMGRSRAHLTPGEVESLIAAAGRVGRHRVRDRVLILLAYRHGLRVSELVALKWDAVDLKAGRLHVNRKKRGTPSTQPIEGDELRALRALQRAYPGSPFLLAGERGPLSRSAVSKIVRRAGEAAGIPFPVTPHQLRHACGYYLANKGIPTRTIQAYLGHKNIAHTARYTALSATAFRGLWS